MKHHFFAMHSRMKYINRWALMRNTKNENIAEHSNDVAAIAHAIAVIKNKRFEGELNCERAAVLGLYHDMPEIITGDMPTPVKYHSEKLHNEFLQVENKACEKLVSMLPEDLTDTYRAFFFKENDDEYLWRIVKAADKISALIKCIEEQNAGNREFGKALEAAKASVEKMQLPEAQAFMDDFLESFYLSLDEQNG